MNIKNPTIKPKCISADLLFSFCFLNHWKIFIKKRMMLITGKSIKQNKPGLGVQGPDGDILSRT